MRKIKTIILISIIFSVIGCKKDFLELKRDNRQVVPSSIKDLQALLDDANRTMNSSSSHELGTIGGDENLLSYDVWRALSKPFEKNGFIWDKIIYEGNSVNDWDNAYRRILFANTALDGIKKLTPSAADQIAWNNVKGSALFYRGFNFYQLAQLFSKPFNKETAINDLGIPLRLEADVTIKTPRANNLATYNQIISDLEIAFELLPDQPVTIWRPSRPAAAALLARVYLQIGDYNKAIMYAGDCLKIKSSLIDLNKVNLNADYTFPLWGATNPEVVFLSYMANISSVTTTRINVNPEIIGLYGEFDLRKKAYFRQGTNNRTLFKGSYIGSSTLFTGLAVDEVLLIRAECYVRSEQIGSALTDLNYLLKARISADKCEPITLSSAEELLSFILNERRRELLFRGTRWSDLRRLNAEEKFAKDLTRNLNNITYTLPANDIRYTWPIPDKALDLGRYEPNPR